MNMLKYVNSLGLAIVIICCLVAVDCNPHNSASAAIGQLAPVLNESRLVITRQGRFEPASHYCGQHSIQAVSHRERELAAARFSFLSRHVRADKDLFKAIKDKDILKLKQYATPALITALFFSLAALVIALFTGCVFCCCCRQPTGANSSNPNLHAGQRLECASAMVVFIVVLAAIALFAAFYGIEEAHGMTSATEAISCSTATLVDTSLYGGVSQDRTKFFTGVATIRHLLETAVRKGTVMIGNFTKALPESLLQVKSLARRVKEDLQYVGSLQQPNQTYRLSYYRPTPAGDAPATIQSSFPRVLGTPDQAVSILGILYRITSGVDIVTGVLEQTTKGLETADYLVKKGATYAKQYIGQLAEIIDIIDEKTLMGLYKANDYTSIVTASYIAYFVVSAALALLLCAVLLAIVVGNKDGLIGAAKCLCCFVWVLSLFGLIVALVLACAVPATFMACQPVNQAFSSQSSLTQFLTHLGLGKALAKQGAACLPGRDGKILGQAPIHIASYLQLAKTVLTVTEFISGLDTAFLNYFSEQAVKIIDSYDKARINDIIHDQPTYQWFLRLARSEEHQEACKYSPAYFEDRLVPSTDVKSRIMISCHEVPIVAHCRKFSKCPAGCIDLTQMMSHYPNATAWKQDVYVRYEGGTCGKAMAESLGQLYTNWHTPRTHDVNGIRGINRRLKLDAATNIDAIEKIVNELKYNFTRNINVVRYLLGNVSEENVGMLAGLNCKPLSERGMRLKDVVCVRTFNTLYGLLLTTAVCAHCLLMLSCLAGCLIYSHPTSSPKWYDEAKLTATTDRTAMSTLASSYHPEDESRLHSV